MISEFASKESREKEFIERLHGRSGTKQERVASILRNAVLLRFSKLEFVHLLIGTGLVTGVGLAMFDYRFRLDFLAIFVSAFLVHEFGHKFLAQAYHSWAEFRLLLFGAAVTAFSALPIMPLKFIAPGAVMVGPIRADRLGKVAWIGPLTNLAMGMGFVATFYLATGLGLQPGIFALGVWFNAWIAVFNLIPFMGLDGAKILSWSKLAWVLTLAGAIGMFVLAESLIGGIFLRF